MKYYYVYIHICLINSKAYIGWSVNPKNRWMHHCAAKDELPFHRAIRKYGKECFESQIIFRTTNIEEVKQKEIEFIKQFETLTPNGYNLSKGGDGRTCKHTEKAKKNMRGKKKPGTAKALKGKKRLEISKRMMGNKYGKGGVGRKSPKGFQGHKQSDKHKKVMIRLNKDPKLILKRKITRLYNDLNKLEQELGSI